MISCPVCHSKQVKKSGSIEKVVITKSGKKIKKIQNYRCVSGHFFKGKDVPSWDDTFIEQVVYFYLRCLSLNTTLDLIRSVYDEELLNKSHVLEFVEWVADALPTLDDIDRLFCPHRSGYLAFDGTWFKLSGEQKVLLICFDPISFDVVSAIWADDEDSHTYGQLMTQVLKKLPKDRIKGVYGDGDKGLILSLKHHLPQVPFQLCVVHKNFRMSQTVPVHSAKSSKRFTPEVKEEILTYSQLFQDTLYANSREECTKNLLTLLEWTQKHPREKFIKAVAQLKHNFAYTLTHFDYPGMQRDNNLLECFNGCIKPRFKLMKGFKKENNLDRYLKLFLIEFRFRPLRESRFKQRRSLSPLELGGVRFPVYYNFLNFLRLHLNLKYQPIRT